MDRYFRPGLGDVFHEALAPPGAIDSHDESVDAAFENHALAFATIGSGHVLSCPCNRFVRSLLFLHLKLVKQAQRGRLRVDPAPAIRERSSAALFAGLGVVGWSPLYRPYAISLSSRRIGRAALSGRATT